MTLWQVIRECIVLKYANGAGRSSREAFIIYTLCYILFCLFWGLFIIMQIDWNGDINLLDFVLMYIPFLFLSPFIALCVRRFHDLDKSGWYVLLLLIPFINIFGLGLLLGRGMPGSNRFGPPPGHISL